MPSVKAVLFDYSGTLFRLDEDESWFDGIGGAGPGLRAELMDALTHPTNNAVAFPPEIHHAWRSRDLDPALHRQAYLYVLHQCGLDGPQAEALYHRVIDASSWTPYPDTAVVLNSLRAQGFRTAVVSNIPWDIRSTFTALGTHADEYVLSYEVGAVKPDPRIFQTALSRLGVPGAEALMVGDSEENDGAARDLGCSFALVAPLPTADRPTGLVEALENARITVKP